ncbi:uncharacterized protein PGTG_19389 [Puccinia graminis f. sp. tritici CRL 75-36-700-3]|uniref:Zinc finger PHD-type domain-containing protein n=1 Tax=Puccinia graminis f. sp. tritici (strain CRL 75-36-700-3 / race SCCL) TaxID=418459 RepID=E3LAA2_PUCGT|nr:uncharacterized protein PGTG_19389 [Puccinia graminis f. sp. tritici CRL 75-36-700-3]EFP93477.2 hypothetical protein PGTG_19389 [Puccinia graminis f. sp. tritici CRL 75-36-700-3]
MTKNTQELSETLELNGEVYAVNGQLPPPCNPPLTSSLPPAQERNADLTNNFRPRTDHVYVSSPWHMADGAPWLIGRIMEFIRESLPTGSHKKKKSRPIVQFKLANYHRQRDLNSRHILDCRLLEASMSHEVFCVSRLRGKCKVEFKNDRSSDEIEAWKAAPDCFYFSQGRYVQPIERPQSSKLVPKCFAFTSLYLSCLKLFWPETYNLTVYGRFTHRHYDLILTQNIKNAPPEVVQFLRNNYSYIFAEPGMGAELSEERRGCVTCRQWTTGMARDLPYLQRDVSNGNTRCLKLFYIQPSIVTLLVADSVTCALCGGAYHFACLNPPLIRKPDRGHRWARGYQWACAPCSKKRQESIEDQALALTKESTEESAVATSSSGPAAAASGRSLRDKGKKKEPMVTALVQPGNGPDGVLRTVDGWPFRYYGRFTEPASVLDPMDSPHIYTAPRVGSRHQTMVPVNPSIETGNASSSIQSAGRPVKADKRSRDGTPVNVSCFASTEDSDLNDYIRDAAQLPVARHVGVTILDGALKTLSEVSSLEEARVKLGEKTIKNLGFVNWTEGDSDKVDKVVSQLGDDLRAIRKAFPKKSGGDITKFFYMFKGHKFPEVSAHDARIDASISHSPDESSCLLPTPSSKRPYTCVYASEICTYLAKCPEALMRVQPSQESIATSVMCAGKIQRTKTSWPLRQNYQSSRCPKFFNYSINFGARAADSPAVQYQPPFAT